MTLEVALIIKLWLHPFVEYRKFLHNVEFVFSMRQNCVFLQVENVAKFGISTKVGNYVDKCVVFIVRKYIIILCKKMVITVQSYKTIWNLMQ